MARPPVVGADRKARSGETYFNEMSEKPSNIPPGFFITATDTGIGKTFVCRLLIASFMKIMPVTYFKPVQTGCLPDAENELKAPDFEYILEKGLTRTREYHTHVPYRFKEACSPHLAARLARRDISFNYINDCFQKLAKHGDRSVMVIVEGAGGVFTPLGKGAFMLDLMALLDLPVVLVVSPKLGTLNHTLLSMGALRERSLRLAGVVMNDPYGLPQDFMYADNKEFIREQVSPTPFVHIPFFQQSQSDGAVDSMSTSFGLPGYVSLQALEDFCRELLR
jgi:dethiobiotin synthase